ncbi:MAG TPA: hypothetical protein VFD51_00660 [Patescibacteria group bacterium]|nr:hypothetical protein [Patescibacteria group bacterium]
MISERKQFILQTIVGEYIENAQPVSSGMLVSKYNLEISPATVRNEMMELEEEGFIYQPHTSSGRVPTEKAYKLFLSDLEDGSKNNLIKDSEFKALEKVFKLDEASFRQTAKTIAELADGAVFWALHKNDLYYTGLSNLFSQPEFKQAGVVCDVSIIIDRLEEIIDDVFEDLEEGQRILIGEDNPFGNFLSVALVKYKYKNSHGLLGILGPMRMDYGRNLRIIKYINEKFA